MVDKLLLRTLKDLGNDAFQEFKWYLKQKNLDGAEPIAVSDLEDADRGHTVSQMTRSYGEKTAVEVAVEILKEISNRQAAAELTKKYAGAVDLLDLQLLHLQLRLDVGSGRECDRRSDTDMVDELLLWTLEDLGEDDFGTFKWYLDKENLDGVEPIPKSKLECASRTKTVSQMTRSYVKETAVKVAVEILRKMRNMNAAEKLTKKYAATGPPAASPPAANTMLAQDGSVIVAPTVSGSIHTLNLTINNEHNKTAQ
ncbi:hypothetical protein F7725_005974 [Dissostichus mawsoni]|uniref:Pyrin domain-containing protein n=1 Tax=Dissostichus mawsoni TaxID=36200 RepID=A0A7J5YV54_DISMA|nr:hypothetical protein F7725_005974 [Dissostichus mawsoni]